MTDEEMAEEYVNTLLKKDDSELDKFLDESLGNLKLTAKQAGVLLGITKGVGIISYLAGLKAGRPKWHKVADGYLPSDKDIKALENENNQLKSRLEEIKRKAEFLQFLILNA